MSKSLWPCAWYANGEYQTDIEIRLTDEQIKVITKMITDWTIQND